MRKGLQKAAIFAAAALVTGTAAGAADRRHRVQERRPRLAARRGPARLRDHGPHDPDRVRERRRLARLVGPVHRLRASRCGAERRRAAARRPLHVEGFLQGPRALDGSALLPLQQPGRHRGAVGREHDGHDRRQRAGLGRLGLLRPRLSARSDREPVSVQDGARALRGAARRDDEARRREPAPDGRAARGVDGPLRASRQHDRRASGLDGPRQGHEPAVVLVPHAAQPDDDDPVAADARVSDAHGSRGLPRRQHERAAVAVAVLLARRLHAPLARVRGLGVAHRRGAVRGADRHGRGAQLHHDGARRPRVQDGRLGAALGRRTCRAGTARRSASGTATR